MKKEGGEPFERGSSHRPLNIGGEMIIFTSVNLKEILKKRRVTRGNVRTDVLIVMRLKSGDTGMYLLILMA